MCSVCGKGVGANSIQCSDCYGWVHKRCSGARCPLVTIQSFRCRICLREEGVRSEGEMMENLNLKNREVLEGVSKFCYLGDMSNGGGSSLASISRITCGWKKFRELSGILTSKKVALRLKGKVYRACVGSSMIYGSETWAVNAELEAKLEIAELRMMRWMCGVSLREKTNAELRESMGIEKISDVMRRSRLRWMEHVLRKEGNDWVKKSMDMIVEGSRGRGRPKMTWEKVVERDMKVRGLVRNDA